MRIFLGLALVAALFCLGAAWNRRLGSEIESTFRRHAGEVRTSEWGEVIVGRPSGAEPVFVPRRRPRAGAGVADAGEARGRAPEPVADPLARQGASADFVLTVQPGQVLSRIVQVHYGRYSPELVDRLADYNGLDHPDKLRAGDRLRLPPEEKLRAPVVPRRPEG